MLQNRNGIIYTIRLPDIVKPLKAIPGRWKLDGEVVFISPKTGEEMFTPCQRRCSTQYPDPYFREQFPVRFEVFDLLEAGGVNVEREPYCERKDRLYKLLAVNTDDAVEYVPYDCNLPETWEEAVKLDREGLIVKQLESPYEEGDRSFNWLKVKNWRFERCNVVGFTTGERARSHFFGSLVLERNGQFRGCAGSGFNEWELRRFKDMFSDAPRMPKPYSDEQVGDPYTAVKVDVQVLVKYYQITENKVFRFPIFIA